MAVVVALGIWYADRAGKIDEQNRRTDAAYWIEQQKKFADLELVEAAAKAAQSDLRAHVAPQ
jgi:hypothetical protein